METQITASIGKMQWLSHWHSSHYAVTHVHNKKITFKGGLLMW